MIESAKKVQRSRVMSSVKAPGNRSTEIAMVLGHMQPRNDLRSRAAQLTWLKRTTRASGKNCLANLVAFQTMLLVPGSRLAVLRFNFYPVWAGIFVVIDLAVFRRILSWVRMIWRYFWHVLRMASYADSVQYKQQNRYDSNSNCLRQRHLCHRTEPKQVVKTCHIWQMDPSSFRSFNSPYWSRDIKISFIIACQEGQTLFWNERKWVRLHVGLFVGRF